MGGIGTHVLRSLLEREAREVHIWDDDIVEASNLPVQSLYCPLDIGYSKVESAARYVEERGFNTQIISHNERVTTKTTELSGVVMSGVHDMSGRSTIWETLEFNSRVFLYIDARIGGSNVQVLTVDPNMPEDVDLYKSWLFPDSEALELGCATRENPDSAQAAGQMLGTHLALHIEGKSIVRFVQRDLRSESMSQEQPLLAQF